MNLVTEQKLIAWAHDVATELIVYYKLEVYLLLLLCIKTKYAHMGQNILFQDAKIWRLVSYIQVNMGHCLIHTHITLYSGRLLQLLMIWFWNI